MPVSFTDRELDIMTVLWEHGPSTVAEVREHLADDLAHTTVQTMLRILSDKGYVAHVEEGRAHRFRALVQREEAARSALRRVVDSLLDGSPSLVLTHLIRDRKLSRDEIAAMRQMLDDAPAPAPKPKRRGGRAGDR
jgi:predicted transcriptional regulator